MPKKSKKRRSHEGATKQSHREGVATRRRTWRVKLIAALLCSCALLAAGYAATRYEPLRRAAGMRPLLAPAAQQQGALPLAKEYVYAGGRLVATVEPTPTPTGPPPGNLVAVASFPNPTAAAVKLTWSAPPTGSAPTAYVVERASARVSDGVKTEYAPLGQPVTDVPTQTSPYLDPTPPEQGMVYAYRVRALYAGGYSGYSNQDVATTFRYTGDDPLVGANDPGNRRASVVSAAIMTELREVVEAVRVLAGSGAATWKQDPPPASKGPIWAEYFTELRTQLNPALEALGISPMPADASIESKKPVKKEHVQDVREKVR